MKKMAEIQKKGFYELGIVIPVLNDNIRITNSSLSMFAQNNPNVLISFILDIESKNTIEKLKHIQLEKTDNIIVNTFQTLSNKVEAIRLVMLFLNNYTNVANIGYLDPSIDIELENLLSLAKYKNHFPQFQIVLGSRIPYVNSDYNKINLPKSEGWMNKLYKAFDSHVLKTGFHDIFCNAKVFNSKIIPFIFNETFKDAELFEFELFLRLQKKFGKSSIQNGIVEFPIFKWKEYQSPVLSFGKKTQLTIKLFQLYFNYSLSHKIKNKISGIVFSMNQLQHKRHNYSLSSNILIANKS